MANEPERCFFCADPTTIQDNDAMFNTKMETLITHIRRMLPEQSETARAIDHREPFETIALKAIKDGYIETADELNGLLEACLRSSV